MCLSDSDQTFDLMEKLLVQHSQVLGFLEENPSFDPVRIDPRVSDLLRRVGLPH